MNVTYSEKIALIETASRLLTPEERRALTAWEGVHVSGDGQHGTSDWPGWTEVFIRVSTVVRTTLDVRAIQRKLVTQFPNASVQQVYAMLACLIEDTAPVAVEDDDGTLSPPNTKDVSDLAAYVAVLKAIAGTEYEVFRSQNPRI
jgi:hypothetical protein